MNDIDDFDVASSMIAYGGSLVSALGHLWLIGDPDNRERIKKAWPEYWQKYQQIAAMDIEQRPQV